MKSCMSKQEAVQWGKAALIATLIAGTTTAMASTGGAEFNDVYDTLSGWSKGSLGKVISMGMFIVGLAAGITKQSVMAAAVGVGGSLVMNYGPGVIDSMFTALI